jgi:hypothetical protein
VNILFADRLTNLQIAGSTVRLEFSILDMVPGNNLNEPKTNVSYVLVMPLEGFVQSFNGQETVVKKLLADGVLTSNAATAAAAPATPTTPAAS